MGASIEVDCPKCKIPMDHITRPLGSHYKCDKCGYLIYPGIYPEAKHA